MIVSSTQNWMKIPTLLDLTVVAKASLSLISHIGNLMISTWRDFKIASFFK